MRCCVSTRRRLRSSRPCWRASCPWTRQWPVHADKHTHTRAICPWRTLWWLLQIYKQTHGIYTHIHYQKVLIFVLCCNVYEDLFPTSYSKLSLYIIFLLSHDLSLGLCNSFINVKYELLCTVLSLTSSSKHRPRVGVRAGAMSAL